MEEPLISARGISRSFQAGDETITVLRDVDVDIGRVRWWRSSGLLARVNQR
ncbi:hypothetical protein [Pseudorhodobacter aquimaris]|uniref:hypothetical protein n=1 Tax=Pseudorhodobacter aquimaris TaxID=687412 RepID=UPI000AF8BF6A|nr:hypothetical protein [Pseudorhodobacter aquimaris]